MRTRKSWWGPATASLAMTALLVSGCGSETDTTTPTREAGASETQQQEPAETVGSEGTGVTSEPAEATGSEEPAETDDPAESSAAEEPTGSDDAGATEGSGESSGPALPSAPDGGTGRLEVDSIGGVALPADPDAVAGALLPQLGEPDTDDEVAGCLDAPDGGVTRRIIWGDVKVYGTAPTAEELQITSWEVTGTAGTEDLALPADLTIGASTEEAEAALPDAEWIDEGLHGGPLLLDGELAVSLDGESGEVISFSSNIGLVSCD